MDQSKPNWMKTQARHAALRMASAWDILRDAFANYFKNGSINQAAAIALYALLSIIPLFILSVLAASRFLGANPQIQTHIVDIIKSFHPYFSGDLLGQLGQIDAKRKVLGTVGVVTLVWFSSLIFSALETALDIAFRSKTHRNFFLSKLQAISMIPLGWIVGSLSVLLTYVTTLLSSQTHSLPLIVLRFLVPLLVSAGFVTIVFKVIPSKKIRLGTAMVGAFLFSALVELVKHAFTWYVAHHTRYHAIFGSLETVVILVLWVFYMALIFLFCAEIMSSYERRDLILIERALLASKTRTLDERLFRKFGRVYPMGTLVCREGDHGREMFFILSGKVRLEKKAGHVKKVLAELEAGHYFGEMAALIEAPRAASAVAGTDCDLAVIDGEIFRRLLRESDNLSITMLKEFSRRISNTNTALDEVSQSWIRLAVLLLLCRKGPWSRERDALGELQAHTGKDPSDLLEVLEDLAAHGLVSLDGDRIVALDPDRAWGEIDRLSQDSAKPVAG